MIVNNPSCDESCETCPENDSLTCLTCKEGYYKFNNSQLCLNETIEEKLVL